MATLVELGPGPVNETERDVVRRLVDELPHYYRVFPNLTFRDRRNGHAYEYDVVVLTGHAAYVVEVKGWRGPIRSVNRRDWQLSSGRFTRNPLPLNEQKARVLKSVLEKVEVVRQGETLRAPYVQSVLVATDEARFEVFPEDADYCFRASELAAYLCDPNRLRIHAEKDRYQGGMRKLAQAVSGQLEARALRPRRFGSYVVTSTLEQSDDLATYLAKHAEFDDGREYRIRTYAVSSYRFDGAERERRLSVLKRSAEALHRIGDHPNISTLREFGDTDDGFFEVTDHSDAGTLATAIAVGALGKLPLERRLAILTGIARGLVAAHAQGVCHRDLRPEVILLGPDGLPRVGGFEVAFIQDAVQTVYGDAGLVNLDPHPYRAPEVRDPKDYDVFDNTDLYPLGRIAYDLFAGFQPEGDELPPLEVDAPYGEALTELVAQMVQHDAAGRPESAQAVLETLEAMARPLSPPELTARPKSTYGPEDRIGDNRVLELLARSDTSHVYRVENEVLQEELALKLAVDGADPGAPLAEFRRLGRLHHPNVVAARWGGLLPADDYGVQRSYLLLEYLGKETLADRIAKGPLPPEDAVAILDALASALAAVHEAGLVHRDIKPANILLTSRGPVLADFGTAVDVDDAGAAPVGSARYRAPEVPTEGWDPSADVFAFGSVAYECLTGRRAHGDEGPDSIAEPAPLRIEGLGAPIAEVIASALACARVDRYPDGASLVQALERARRPVEPPAPPPPPERPRTEYGGGGGGDDEPRAWSASWVEELSDAESPTRFFFDALHGLIEDRELDGLERLLEHESHAAALERPLRQVYPSLYAELVTPSSPLAEETLPEEAAPLARRDGELLVIVDGISLAEWELVRERFAGRAAEAWVWRTGPVDPVSRPARWEALRLAFTDVPEPAPAADASAAAAALSDGATCVRVELDRGRRDDPVEAVLEARAKAIREVLAATASRSVTVTSTLPGLYLGHGLRDDVGAGAGARADRVRQAWRSAFQEGRHGDTSPKVYGPLGEAYVSAGGRLFVTGRAGWPEALDAPRIAVGGASLPERLVPLLRFAEAR